jgi:hypothetical protein
VPGMAKCLNCGASFNVAAVRNEYQELVDGGDYEGDLCRECALPLDVQSNMNLGRAIDMTNGEEDYDDDFVQEHL